MINFKPKLPALLGALAVLTAGAAHAELLEYTFKAPNGAQRSLPPNANYANPTGNVSFALSAGIDRKVKISVLRSDGTVVSTATSHLLGATDRITVGGKSYYGAELQLPAPSEGVYKLRAEILASDGSSVQTDEYPLQVDTTAPSLANVTVKGEWIRALSDGTLLLGPNRFSGIDVSASDAGSSVSSIQAYAVDSKGKSSPVVSVNYANGQGQLLNWSTVFPNGEDRYTLHFEALDKAGNKGSIAYPIAWDSVGAKSGENPEPVAVYDPKNPQASTFKVNGQALSGFAPYQNGMTIYSDTYRVLYRIPKTNSYPSSPYGAQSGNWCDYKNCIEGNIIAEDGTYDYRQTQADVFQQHGTKTKSFIIYDWVMNSLGNTSVSVKTDPSVSLAPNGKYVEYLRDDGQWVRGETINMSSVNHYKKLRFHVEPRPYAQELWGTWLPTTKIPANASYAEVDTDISFSGRSCSWPGYWSRPEGKPELPSDRIGASFCYDLNPPEIAGLERNGRIFKAHFREPDSFDGWGVNQWVISTNSSASAITSTGEERPLSRTEVLRSSTNDWFFTFSAENLSEGTYTGISLVAKDAFGNEVKQVFTGSQYAMSIDNSAPTLTVSISDGAPIQSLDDVVITLTDTADPSPKLTSIALVGGPADDKVQLSWREESKGRFRLEYPVMFPSLKEGESYSLTVAGEDAQGNAVQKAVGFEYKPRQVMLADGMDGKVMIPAVTHEFVHADGKRIIETKPLTLSDGAVVTGSYDVFATLRSDAQVPLVVNGVRIEPGQTMGIMSQHDFGASGGRLSIPVKPAVPDEVGSSSLLVMTSAPNSPILVVDINTWKGAAKLSAESWTIRQVIDPVKIYALPELGVPCRFTTKADVAMAADPIRDPVCLLQWDRTPDEAEQTTQDNNGMKVAGLVGQAVSIGEQPVEYSLYLFSGDGSKVKVGSGSQNLTVTTAYGSVSYTPIDDIAQVNRVIEDFNVNFKQSKGPDCSITLNADRAKKEAASKAVGSASRACLFEWQQIPNGLVQDQLSESPYLSGSLAENGVHPMGWRVSIFTRNGTRVTLNDEIFNIEAVDPPAPTVALSSKYNFKNNIYMVPMTGNYLGDVIINSERAALDISISRNSSVLESETFSPGSGAYNKVYRRINTDERPLWEETTYKVNATYNKVPDVKTEVVYKAIAAPSDSIRPIVEVEGDTAIDTQALPIKVLIRDQYKPDGGYDEKTMGKWKVRLIRQKVYNETEPLTDFVFAENGEAQFSVNIKGVDSSSIRIVAEAVLESPVEGYNRTETSLRPAFLTVLKGGAIGADVQSRKLSGQAPFTSVFKLALNDRQDVRATGKVIWETSADDGKTWEQFTPEDRYKYQLVRTFEKGEYKVRAKVFNINSGAEQYTEVVSIIAYDKPKISVSGPATLFIGSEGQYIANLTLNDEEIKDSDAIVEWSTDGGKTYSETGKNITLSSDEVTRYRLWSRVRSISAPPDDSYAYETSKMSVDFVAVKPPRPRVTGPSLIETGKVYTFKAETSLPYRGMEVTMNGFFTLPNGTIVNGDTLEYTPTESDLSQNNIDIKYTVWIEGYREKGAEASHSLRTRVWQYVWPKFGMQVRVDASVAPATVTASVRAIAFNGKLEDPTYDWDLPKGVIIEDQKQGTLRSFVVNEPGDYTIKVNIRDARGHEFVIEQPLKVGQAAPYVVDLQYSGSNPFEREPLDVLLRPYVSGGHPKDRIASRLFSVNGTLIDGGGYYVRTRLGAGEHSIKLKITSEMGHEAEGEVNINVAENKLPACSLSSRETVGSWIVYASCEDTDGRMKSYEWTIAGELKSISSDRLTISKGSYEAMPTISLVGIDDSGGRSEAVTMN
ncbi:Ig-like domain-containing protein [Shewanella sp. 8A]|uniref:Ig-like domain-containing protein n=1 Tax=Shewanella sp. 8A TaxID=2943323 RepID=UPI00201A6C39|nr:Ig-like domain-containing protein [Shewanella sp. 8A]